MMRFRTQSGSQYWLENGHLTRLSERPVQSWDMDEPLPVVVPYTHADPIVVGEMAKIHIVAPRSGPEWLYTSIVTEIVEEAP
jgi:hypothetical protein